MQKRKCALTYEKIKETFEKEGCVLLTTEEEMKEANLSSLSKYRIISSCGHVSENCWFHMFANRGTGKICKTCIDVKLSKHNKKLTTDLVSGNSYSMLIEHKSFELIKKLLTYDVCVEQTPECCLADLAIKDRSCDENKWMPVQIKATLKGQYSVYSFQTHNKYPNMWVILVCIEEEKFWIINGNEIQDQCMISIGMKKSRKYEKYSVDKTHLVTKLLELYRASNLLQPIDAIKEPLTDNCKLEQQYRKMRERYLSSIIFEYPEMNQGVTDFMINGFNVQEKTASNKGVSSVTIAKRSNRKYVAYHVKDNDFYWINDPDKIHFYIFSSELLVDQNRLSTDNQQGKTRIHLGNEEWMQNCKYSYTEYNINIIIANLFGLHKTIIKAETTNAESAFVLP